MATLKHDMRHFSLSNISDNDTRRSYARSIDKFCSWLEDTEGKRLKMKDLKGIKLETVNAYSKYLQEHGYSFSDCTSLDNIRLPNSLDVIGDYAFINCTSLSSPEIRILLGLSEKLIFEFL